MLTTAKTIAVIGLSEDPSKPSHYVSAYMQQHGYKIYPVNPSIPEVLGEKSYASLSDLPIKPDIVNVFRLPKFIPAIVDEMLELGLQTSGSSRESSTSKPPPAPKQAASTSSWTAASWSSTAT